MLRAPLDRRRVFKLGQMSAGSAARGLAGTSNCELSGAISAQLALMSPNK